METYKDNEAYFDAQAKARYDWKESVEHVAPGFHRRARELANRSGRPLRVVDLGAGDTGLSTYPHLREGSQVFAVDSSGESLNRLQHESRNLEGELICCHGDVSTFIDDAIAKGERYDIVIARSFLHHIPDYLSALRKTVRILTPTGVFLSYEDPPRYDTSAAFDLFYSRMSYFTWRIFRGNYMRGLKTRLRRLRAVLDNRLPEDVVEYHVVRNGVDDEAIKQLFSSLGFTCEITKYFTTDNIVTKYPGRWLNVKNSFSALAYRQEEAHPN